MGESVRLLVEDAARRVGAERDRVAAAGAVCRVAGLHPTGGDPGGDRHRARLAEGRHAGARLSA